MLTIGFEFGKKIDFLSLIHISTCLMKLNFSNLMMKDLGDHGIVHDCTSSMRHIGRVRSSKDKPITIQIIKYLTLT